MGGERGRREAGTRIEVRGGETGDFDCEKTKQKLPFTVMVPVPGTGTLVYRVTAKLSTTLLDQKRPF